MFSDTIELDLEKIYEKKKYIKQIYNHKVINFLTKTM